MWLGEEMNEWLVGWKDTERAEWTSVLKVLQPWLATHEADQRGVGLIFIFLQLKTA